MTQRWLVASRLFAMSWAGFAICACGTSALAPPTQEAGADANTIDEPDQTTANDGDSDLDVSISEEGAGDPDGGAEEDGGSDGSELEPPFGCGPACMAMVASTCAKKPTSLVSCIDLCRRESAVLDANTGCGDTITAKNECIGGRTLTCVEDKPVLEPPDCSTESQRLVDCVEARVTADACKDMCNGFIMNGCLPEDKSKWCGQECSEHSRASLFVFGCPTKFETYIDCMTTAAYQCDQFTHDPLVAVPWCKEVAKRAAACLGL